MWLTTFETRAWIRDNILQETMDVITNPQPNRAMAPMVQSAKAQCYLNENDV